MSGNQLGNIIALLKEKTSKSSKEIIYNFTADGNSVIVASKLTGAVGLIALGKKGHTISFYDVNIGRYKWAKTEGFNTEEMSSNKELRKSIFESTTKDNFINRLTGE